MRVEDPSFNPLPWSWSKLNMARKCSYAVWLGHNQLIPTSQQAPQRQETEDGLVLHKLANFFLSDGSAKHTFTIPDGYTIPSYFFTHLGNFFRRDLPRLRELIGNHFLLPELRVGIDRQLRPVYGFPNGYLVGSLDLALYNPETQDLIIVDYKTERNPAIDLTEYYRAQLELYVFLFNHAYKSVKRFQLAIHAVAPDELKWLTDGWTEFDPEVGLRKVVSLITEATENLKTIEPSENPLCIYCSYKHQCPLFSEG